MSGLAINRSIMMFTISRALSQETTRPALDLAELDAVGDVEHPVQNTEARIGEVVDGGGGTDADTVSHPAGGGRLEAFPAHAGINEDVDVSRLHRRRCPTPIGQR